MRGEEVSSGRFTPFADGPAGRPYLVQSFLVERVTPCAPFRGWAKPYHIRGGQRTARYTDARCFFSLVLLNEDKQIFI